MHIFPYKSIKEKSKIIIYGCGNVGIDYIGQILKTGYCEIVCCLDRDAKNIKIDGVQILQPEVIKNMVDYDFVLIALNDTHIANEVQADLIKLGVDNKKIITNIIERLKFQISDIKQKLENTGFVYINNRIDMRLLRLEILQYYGIPENLAKLDAEQKKVLQEVQNFYDMDGRVIKEDPYYNPPKTQDGWNWKIFEDDIGFYALIDNKKVYISDNRNFAEQFGVGIKILEAEDSPHRYLDPQKDGIDVPDNAVLLDIGACEGYFGMKYLDRCKKVYLFENEFIWIQRLKQSFAQYDHKVEIIPQAVGDTDDCLKLDEFFSSREKFNFVKMDVEGAEGAVLRSMRKAIEDDNPLTLLIATYHRQDDWDRYEKFLNPDPNNPRYDIFSSDGYYWHLQDAKPPFFRRGIMRAKKRIKELK